MRCDYACDSPEHVLSRRQFLAGSAAGLGGLFGLGAFARPALADALKAARKRVVIFFLHGGVSQLESWDPKPGTDTGGPFAAIPTSVPGVHISELLPHTAMQMHRMAVVRGINTAEDDHSKGAVLMQTGRRQEPAMTYPHLGSVVAKLLAPDDSPVPGYVHITPAGEGGFNRSESAYLGPKYASVVLGDGKPPVNLLRPAGLTEEADQKRNALRAKHDQRFGQRRRTAETEAYVQSYEQAAQLMRQRHLFDISSEPAALADRYGRHDFGRHCLLARRLLEHGVTFVNVMHSNYDTHYENFDFHIEQLGEFDQPFATLIDDLAQRGLLESTLVIVMSEFGRTPKINRNFGRDHWSKAWSIALAGCGITGGAAVGKTNANGTAVTDREVNQTHLWHTYLKALGLNPTKNFYTDGRPIPAADPKGAPIKEVLA
jgi:uncharacterized protein (DUF1501 family)